MAKHIAAVDERTRAQNKEALEVLAKRGIKTVQVDAESLERFSKINGVVAEKLSKTDFSPEVLSKARQLLAAYREKKSKQ